MSALHASRIYEALEACDGSPEGDARVDQVLSSIPWNEVEVVMADNDLMHDAIVVALTRWTPTGKAN
jgi:hypothetical protein